MILEVVKDKDGVIENLFVELGVKEFVFVVIFLLVVWLIIIEFFCIDDFVVWNEEDVLVDLVVMVEVVICIGDDIVDVFEIV